MEVPSEEPTWLSNLRAGILQVLFSLDALKSNLGTNEEGGIFAKQPTYSVMEDAIDGQCYTE